MDAIAVTLATRGEYVGVAALGTALTREQARELRRYTDLPIVATDNDKAGQAAAERDYWILTDLGHDPLATTLPEGTDPADLVAQKRATRLRAAVRGATPLSLVLLEQAIAEHSRTGRLDRAIRVVSATNPARWAHDIAALAMATGRPKAEIQSALAAHLGTSAAAFQAGSPGSTRAAQAPGTPAALEPAPIGGTPGAPDASGPER